MDGLSETSSAQREQRRDLPFPFDWSKSTGQNEKAFYFFQLDSGGSKSENSGQLFAFGMGWDGRAIHLRSKREKGGGKAFHPLQGVATEAIGAAQRQDSQSQVLAELTEQQTRYAAFPTPSVNTSKTLMGGSSSRD